MNMNYRKLISEIKYQLLIGVIDYEQAKQKAEPIIIEMNTKGKEIAKKYKQRFKPFTFVQLMR